jgi:hypothetical protein
MKYGVPMSELGQLSAVCAPRRQGSFALNSGSFGSGRGIDRRTAGGSRLGTPAKLERRPSWPEDHPSAARPGLW